MKISTLCAIILLYYSILRLYSSQNTTLKVYPIFDGLTTFAKQNRGKEREKQSIIHRRVYLSPIPLPSFSPSLTHSFMLISVIVYSYILKIRYRLNLLPQNLCIIILFCIFVMYSREDIYNTCFICVVFFDFLGWKLKKAFKGLQLFKGLKCYLCSRTRCTGAKIVFLSCPTKLNCLLNNLKIQML